MRRLQAASRADKAGEQRAYVVPCIKAPSRRLMLQRMQLLGFGGTGTAEAAAARMVLAVAGGALGGLP